MSAQHRVLVTGVNGFVGLHLVAELVSRGHTVVGAGLGQPPEAVQGYLQDYVECDLSRSWPDVDRVDRVVHLAALSAVGPSFQEPQTYIEVNSAMVTGLGEWQLGQDEQARVLVVSSGAVYESRQPLPIGEGGAVGFTSPYAVSKVLVENIAAYYAGRGLDWSVLRPFNHIGPGQGPGFLLPDLVAGLRKAESGDGVLRVGDLSRVRDFTDVRDIVGAYCDLVDADSIRSRLFNVCSGRGLAGSELLRLVQNEGIGTGVSVETDPALLRPNDPEVILGDATRIRSELGWAPTIPVEQTVRDFCATVVAHDGEARP